VRGPTRPWGPWEKCGELSAISQVAPGPGHDSRYVAVIEQRGRRISSSGDSSTVESPQEIRLHVSASVRPVARAAIEKAFTCDIAVGQPLAVTWFSSPIGLFTTSAMGDAKLGLVPSNAAFASGPLLVVTWATIEEATRAVHVGSRNEPRDRLLAILRRVAPVRDAIAHRARRQVHCGPPQPRIPGTVE
jgi:hypothetical protein